MSRVRPAGQVTVPEFSSTVKSSSCLGLILIGCLFPQVTTLRTRLQRDWSGLDVVLLHDAAEAEDLSLGGGDPLFEVTLGGSPGGAFVPEPGSEYVHDAAVGRDGRGRCRGPGGLLRAQSLDAAAQLGVGVKEVQAHAAGAGDGTEVDLLSFFDQLPDG